MKKMSVALVALIVMAVGVKADTVTSVNVVGYMTSSVQGGVSDTYSLMSVPLTKMPVASGSVTTNTSTTITDENANWTVGQFNREVAGQEDRGVSTFYIEVKTGLFEGRHFYIESNTSDTLTINDPGDLASTDLDGQTYKIVPANRIRDIFGDSTSGVTLTGGSSQYVSDTITVWNGTGWSGEIFYFTDGPAWVKIATPPVQADDMVIDRDAAMMVKRLAGQSAVGIQSVGEVSGNDQRVVLEPGLNLVGGMAAVDSELQNSGLNVLTPGANQYDADTISDWRETGWSFDIFQFETAEGDVWVEISDPPKQVDTNLIAAAKGYMVNNKGATKIWVRQSPLK